MILIIAKICEVLLIAFSLPPPHLLKISQVLQCRLYLFKQQLFELSLLFLREVSSSIEVVDLLVYLVELGMDGLCLSMHVILFYVLQ